VAIEKHCNGPPTVAQNVLFFEKFIHSNGVRAQRQAMPMTYQEILVLWSTHINPPSLDSASLGTAVQNELKKMQHLLPPKAQTNKRGGGKTDGSTTPKNTRQDRDTKFCEDWNKDSSCSNTQAPGGCVDQTGVFTKHSCSKKMPRGGFCGSSKHGLPSH
jgi:hypothetical protein